MQERWSHQFSRYSARPIRNRVWKPRSSEATDYIDWQPHTVMAEIKLTVVSYGWQEYDGYEDHNVTCAGSCPVTFSFPK
ncbi:hypothetical protein CS542_05530 [Pedobacter sp. IW39]|nr:hypothetical protein CS542_05530 [Pedobacter sp. IW39]